MQTFHLPYILIMTTNRTGGVAVQKCCQLSSGYEIRKRGVIRYWYAMITGNCFVIVSLLLL